MAPAEGAGYCSVVMAASRLELNLVRLLCRCEVMAAEKRDPDEWRLEKPLWLCPFPVGSATSIRYFLVPGPHLAPPVSQPRPTLIPPLVGSALFELDGKECSKPASEVINEYSRKVDFLKGMLQAEKLTSSSEKALANQFLAPGRVPTTARERVPATKTVHLQSRARYTSEMRSELLGTGLLQPRENVPGGITTSCLWEGLEREEVVPRRNREGPGAWGSPNGDEENIPDETAFELEL
ncbi:Vesicle transport protein USE1 [Pteropus alecto]|uniref:Vesicle transport protein USE1 n=1 Tax=Pteropus alecto TaxID=9402 RepID=L5L793_PTEAL|nr:Vesicle transport protein USE1 [Pteropus alecto]